MPFKIKNGFPSNLALPHFPAGPGWLCPLQPRMGWTPSAVTALACLPARLVSRPRPPSLCGPQSVCFFPPTLRPPQPLRCFLTAPLSPAPSLDPERPFPTLQRPAPHSAPPPSHSLPAAWVGATPLEWSPGGPTGKAGKEAHGLRA